MRNNNYTNKNEYKTTKREIERISLDDALERKLERELNYFKKELKKLPKEKIIEKAYELVCREEIKEELKYMDLHEVEKEMLILQDDVLGEFYKDWLDDDTPLGESMQNTIGESIATLTKYMGKRNYSKGR